VTRRPPGTWATNHLANPILRPLLRNPPDGAFGGRLPRTREIT